MGGIYPGVLIPASVYNRQVQTSLQNDLEYILASEVISEFVARCANGMQYSTFPNRITAEEKEKLTAAGYIVTENVVHSANRHGAPNLYIGFQVALNQTATANAMIISEREQNGIGEDTSGLALYDSDGFELYDADGMQLLIPGRLIT